MRASILAVLTAALLGLGACASVPMAPPTASMDTLQSVQTSGIAPIKVGEFKPGPELPPARDKSINSRASTVKPPSGTSFAAYLGETLATELNAAGKLNGAADLEITGFLTESKLDSAGFETGTGAISARFVMTRGGVVVYDKVLRTEATWPSSFVGAIAIPAAINGYNSLYPKLVRTLLQDPDFVKAAQP